MLMAFRQSVLDKHGATLDAPLETYYILYFLLFLFFFFMMYLSPVATRPSAHSS